MDSKKEAQTMEDFDEDEDYLEDPCSFTDQTPQLSSDQEFVKQLQFEVKKIQEHK